MDYQNIDRGCYQGTVGGPGIFSMYTDDLRPLDSTSKNFKYSDDTNCLSPCMKNPSHQEKERFSKEIQTIVDWAVENGLSLNTEKSKHIRFCLNRMPCCECAYSDEHSVSVNQAKILGVIFQSDCSFRQHCRRLLSELRSSMYLFKDLRASGTSIDDIHHVYESLIVSRVRYGISVYGSDSVSLQAIDKFFQKCFDRKYCKFKFSTMELRHQEDQRHLSNILKNANHPLHDYLTSHRKSRTPRHKFKSTKPYVRTKTFLDSFANRVLPFLNIFLCISSKLFYLLACIQLDSLK